MSSQQFRDQGIAAAKARRTEEARKLLLQAVKLDPRDELAWLYLAGVMQDKKGRLLCLERVLELNPENALAIKAVQAIGLDPDVLVAAVQQRRTQAATGADGTPDAAPEEPDVSGEAEDAEDADHEPVADAASAAFEPEPEPEPADEYPDEYPAEDPYAFIGDLSDAFDAEVEQISPFARAAAGAVSDDQPPAGAGDDDDEIDINASPYDDIDINASPYDDAFLMDVESLEQADDATLEPPAFMAADKPASPFDIDFDALFEGAEEVPLTDETFQRARAAIQSEAPAAAPSAPASNEPPVSNLGLPLPPPLDQSRAGIPLPDVDYLEAAATYAAAVGERYSDLPDNGTQWTLKRRNRAGENEIVRLRARIAGTVIGILAVFGLVAAVILSISPDAQRIVLGVRTATNTLTPTRTFTPTPGLTDTPTPTLDFTANPTFTASPTYNLTFTPQAALNIRTPRPTEIPLYGLLELGVQNAARAINDGRYADALPTLEAERQLVAINFNANPYYYEAIAYADTGEFTRAFDLLEEAEGRLEELSGADLAGYTATVNLAYAEVLIRQGLAARAVGQALPAGAMTQARERAALALEFNLRYSRAHEITAQSYVLERDYDAAYEVLAAAREVEGLGDDPNLYTIEGLAALAQGRDLAALGSQDAAERFARADYLAGYALFLNPYEESAHTLRVEAALAEGDPGKAVRYTQTYRAAYPDSPHAFRLLGDARTAEGNGDLALAAYTRAVELGDDIDALVEALLARAELYTQQRRYDLALADYTRISEARPDDPALQALRMDAAYLAGDYAAAQADIEALRGSRVRTSGELDLLQGMILYDTADGSEPQLRRARDLLDGATVPGTREGMRSEYLARVLFALGDFADAEEAITAALRSGQNGSRRFLSAQIRDALADDLVSAVRDYEWVLAWDTVYAFPFADTASERLTILQTRVVLTQAASGITPTAEAGTPSGATATATPTP
jgi:tetratricopeptide (TPR) repeat protein